MTTDTTRFDSYVESLKAQTLERCLQVSEEDPDEFGALPREEAFTQVAKDILEDLGQVVDGEVCYFERKIGRGIAKVNGWYIEESEGRLDFITTIYNGGDSEARVAKSKIEDAVKRAVRVFVEAGKGYYKEMEPASAAYDMMNRLHDQHDIIVRIRVIVVVNGVAGAVDLSDMKTEPLEVQVDVWDVQRLFRADTSGLAYEELEIDLVERLGAPLSCLPIPVKTPEYGVVLAAFPGGLIHKLYHEYGSRLLELNVRSFLQARGKVNRGIRDTLRDVPSRFLAYNNGISATAHSVDFVPDSDGGFAIRSITGLQIVNGGQTVASIHRACEKDGSDLSDVYVQAKITIIQRDQIDTLVPYISRYANTQNRVNEADFSANHPYHVRIQQLSETVWSPGEQKRWFYERARGQYDVAKSREATTRAKSRQFDERTPRKQKFDKVLLAKALNSWDQLPHIVGRGGQKNFVHFMERLATRGKEWLPDTDYYQQLIAKIIIYKHAESLARKHRFPAYRANAVAYTVSMASFKTAGRVSLESIWQSQEVSPALSETLSDWMLEIYEEIIESAEGRNITEWCKKEDCWRQIQTLDISVPSELLGELNEGQPLPTVGDKSGQTGKGLTEEDRENIARVMQVSPESWIHIAGWGSKTGNLQKWQVGIASTLASYAAAEWSNVPSTKQAARGVEILQVVRSENGPAPEPELAFVS